MKNFMRIFGVIAFILAIAFTVIACQTDAKDEEASARTSGTAIG